MEWTRQKISGSVTLVMGSMEPIIFYYMILILQKEYQFFILFSKKFELTNYGPLLTLKNKTRKSDLYRSALISERQIFASILIF